MQRQEFNELAGRIDGITRVLLFLIADVEEAELIDGEEFTQRLRQFSAVLNFEQPHLEPSKRTILELADRIDTVRSSRQ